MTEVINIYEHETVKQCRHISISEKDFINETNIGVLICDYLDIELNSDSFSKFKKIISEYSDKDYENLFYNIIQNLDADELPIDSEEESYSYDCNIKKLEEDL